MKAYWGSRGIVLGVLDLDTYMEVSGQLHTTAALLQRKSPWYTLERIILKWFSEKCSPCALTEHHAMKAHWGVEI
jgi:hypothetical protein